MSMPDDVWAGFSRDPRAPGDLLGPLDGLVARTPAVPAARPLAGALNLGRVQFQRSSIVAEQRERLERKQRQEIEKRRREEDS